MSKNRIKQPVLRIPPPVTLQEVEERLAQMAQTTNSVRVMTAGMDAELQAVREKYQASIDLLNLKLADHTESLQAWAEANRDDFGKRKSLEFGSGAIGFRTGTPKLKTLRGWTWDRVLAHLRDFCPDFVRMKEEVNKEAILAGVSADQWSEGDLKNMGVAVVQDETFFVEPKLTAVDTRQVSEVAQ